MGAIIAIEMVIGISICYKNQNRWLSEIIGYLSMIVVSSLIFAVGYGTTATNTRTA
jgi:hypothetical protein